jgi:hypothetical protein
MKVTVINKGNGGNKVTASVCPWVLDVPPEQKR